MIWIILGTISAIVLIWKWGKLNAVWGGLTLGVIIGVVVALFSAFSGNGFNLSTVVKIAIIGSLVGGVAELLGITGNFLKKQN